MRNNKKQNQHRWYAFGAMLCYLLLFSSIVNADGQLKIERAIGIYIDLTIQTEDVKKFRIVDIDGVEYKMTLEVFKKRMEGVCRPTAIFTGPLFGSGGKFCYTQKTKENK